MATVNELIPATNAWHTDSDSQLQRWGLVPGPMVGERWVSTKLPPEWEKIKGARGCHYLIDDRHLIRAVIRQVALNSYEVQVKPRFIFRVSPSEETEVVYEVVDQSSVYGEKVIKCWRTGYYAKWSVKTHYYGAQEHIGYFSYQRDCFFHIPMFHGEINSVQFHGSRIPERADNFERITRTNAQKVLTKMNASEVRPDQEFVLLEQGAMIMDAGEALEYLASLPTDGREWSVEFDR